MVTIVATRPEPGGGDCYYESMTTSTSGTARLVLHWLKCAALFSFVLWIAAGPAHAQSADAIFNGPQNMDAGLQSGMNNIAGYVYAILKLLSLIGLGVAYYQITHEGLGKAILATVASILLWFAPVIVNVTRSIGSSAAQQSQVTGRPN